MSNRERLRHSHLAALFDASTLSIKYYHKFSGADGNLNIAVYLLKKVSNPSIPLFFLITTSAADALVRADDKVFRRSY